MYLIHYTEWLKSKTLFSILGEAKEATAGARGAARAAAGRGHGFILRHGSWPRLFSVRNAWRIILFSLLFEPVEDL